MVILHVHAQGGRGFTAPGAQRAGVGNVHMPGLQMFPNVVALAKGLGAHRALPEI